MNFLLSVIVSIASFGAVGDGLADNTTPINRAIAACAERGGGEVRVPAGTFISGTINMRSHVMLRLDSGAVLRGTADLGRYRSFVPKSDLSRYGSGLGTANANSAYDTVWTKTLILFDGVADAGIIGPGVIDGVHVFNPRGEEGRRGPHTIIAASCRRLRFEDFEVRRAANYAFLGYEISRTRFRRVRFSEGWDGIHIRGCRHVAIEQCSFWTGDDAIAGGYWRDMKIVGNDINSSCNGIRMIQPSIGLLIARNHFHGPGLHPHITSGKTSSDAAISLEPGGWGPAPGRLDRIRIKNNRVETVLTPLSVTLSDDNTLGRLTVCGLVARDITRMALSVKSWGRGRAERVVMRNLDLEFRGIDDERLPAWLAAHPVSQWPVFPSWGMYFRNVDRVRLRRVSLSLKGNDYRPPVVTDSVGTFSSSRHSKH